MKPVHKSTLKHACRSLIDLISRYVDRMEGRVIDGVIKEIDLRVCLMVTSRRLAHMRKYKRRLMLAMAEVGVKDMVLSLVRRMEVKEKVLACRQRKEALEKKLRHTDNPRRRTQLEAEIHRLTAIIRKGEN